MGLLRLCQGDPLVSMIRDTYGANIVRTPEARIAPLVALLTTDDTTRFIGHISGLLAEPLSADKTPEIHEAPVASASSAKTRGVDLDLGAKILGGFLGGMSGGRAPDISAELGNAKELSFQFPSVTRRYIDLGPLGVALNSARLNQASALYPALIAPASVLRVIDSVLTCDHLELNVESTRSAKAGINVPVIQDVLGKAKLNVSSKGDRHLRIQSESRLAFAFTCVNIATKAGTIRAVAPTQEDVGGPRLRDPAPGARLQAHVLLTLNPELVEFAESPQA